VCDRTILLCGTCLNKFKHAREFCTICYKLYSDTSSLVHSTEFTRQGNQLLLLSFSFFSSENLKLFVYLHNSVTNDETSTKLPSTTGKLENIGSSLAVETDEQWMIQCNECNRWVHAKCEGIDHAQYQSISEGTHPIWVRYYFCYVKHIY
jgi:hypothetical protein